MMKEICSIEEQAERLKRQLGCPCTGLPSDVPSIMAAYKEAAERGKREGFTPILLVLDQWGNPSFDDLNEFQREMAAAPIEDGKALMRRFEAEAREEWGEDLTREELVEHLNEVLGGEMTEGQEITEFLSLTDYQGQVQPAVLAEIPVKDPWEVFAYLPFGGWNECPAPEEQRAAAKYWFEQYGAVPAVMTSDVLEYALPAPVPRERALELALEQYFFCADIVDQGVGTVGTLADGLAKSSYWYFWWD